MTLEFKFASQNYDRVRPLTEGRIQPEGIALKHVELPAWFTFPRMVRDKEFECSELGITIYVGTLGLEKPPFIAIPVFLSRTFRRSQIYINAKSGIRSPKDLIGKRIGEAALHGHDAAVWPRGILADEHGVPFDSATYVVGGMNSPVPEWDWSPFKHRTNMRVEHIGDKRCLDDMLRVGEIDALYTAITPKSWLKRSPNVRLLFEDCRADGARFLSQDRRVPDHATGRHPPRHLRAEPLGPRALYDAFRKSKQEVHDLYDQGYGGRLHLSDDPLVTDSEERNRREMGDDPWPYGVEPNRKTLEAFLRYHHEQGFSRRRFAPEEIFAPRDSVD